MGVFEISGTEGAVYGDAETYDSTCYRDAAGRGFDYPNNDGAYTSAPTTTLSPTSSPTFHPTAAPTDTLVPTSNVAHAPTTDNVIDSASALGLNSVALAVVALCARYVAA